MSLRPPKTVENEIANQSSADTWTGAISARPAAAIAGKAHHLCLLHMCGVQVGTSVRVNPIQVK